MKLYLLNLTFWGWVMGRVLCEAFLKLPPEKGEPCLSRQRVSWWNVMPPHHQRSSLGRHAVLQGCWSPYVSLNEYCWTWQIKIWSHGVFLFFAQLWSCSYLFGIPVEKQDRVDQTTCSWPGVAWLCPRSLVSHEPDRHRSQETATGCPWPLPPSLSPHLRENYRHPGTESPLYQWFSMDIAYAQWSGKVLYPKHI